MDADSKQNEKIRGINAKSTPTHNRIMNNTAKFKALVGLAKADGEFDMHEKLFISYLAEQEGMSMDELKAKLKKGEKMSDLIQDLSYEEKIDILTYVVKLMKADGKVMLTEVKYCEKLATVFGFEEKSIGYLSGALNDNPRIAPNMGMIMRSMKNYLLEVA